MEKIKMLNLNDFKKFWNIEWNNENYKITYNCKESTKFISNINKENIIKDLVLRKIKRGYGILDHTNSFLLTSRPSHNNTILFLNFESKKDFLNYINKLKKYIELSSEFYCDNNIEYTFYNDSTNDYELLFKDININIDELNFDILKEEKFNSIIVLNEIEIINFSNNIKIIETKMRSKRVDLFNEVINYELKNSNKLDAAILLDITKKYYKNTDDIYSLIGWLYEINNNIRAIYYYKKAVELKEEEGLLNLARCYLYGIFVDVDYKKSYDLFNLMAEDTEKKLFYTSYTMKRIFNDEINYNIILENFNTLINSDFYRSESYCELGDMYLNGLGVVQDIQLTFYYYRKSIEEKNSFTFCKNDLTANNKLIELKKSYDEIINIKDYFDFDEVDFKIISNLKISSDWKNILIETNKEIKKTLVINLYKKNGFIKFSEQLSEKIVDVILIKDKYTNDFNIVFILDTYNGFTTFLANIHTADSYNFFLKEFNNESLNNLYQVLGNGFFYSESFVSEDFIRSTNQVISVIDENNQFSLNLDEIDQEYIMIKNEKTSINQDFLTNTYWLLTDCLNLNKPQICINKMHPNFYFKYTDITRSFKLVGDINEIIDDKLYDSFKILDM